MSTVVHPRTKDMQDEVGMINSRLDCSLASPRITLIDATNGGIQSMQLALFTRAEAQSAIVVLTLPPEVEPLQR